MGNGRIRSMLCLIVLRYWWLVSVRLILNGVVVYLMV